MGLFKRGKIWWYYLDGAGRKSTKMTNKKKAEDVYIEVLKSVSTGAYKPTTKALPHPFDIVVESYLQDRARRGKRADSFRKMKDWTEAFGSKDITRITLADVEQRLGDWRDTRGWSNSTYNGSLSTISGVFSFAYRKGWIDRHPLKGRAERLPVNNERHRYFHPHELQAMQRTAIALARLKGHPRHWLANIIIGAAFTGIRRGALCALRCRDVYRDESGEPWLRIGQDKNGLPLDKRLVGALRDHAERRLARKAPMAFLFPGPGQGNARASVERFLPIVVRKVGQRHPDWNLQWGRKHPDGTPNRDGVTFHTFRHAMASIALNAGAPMDVVQRMGNWKGDEMVRRYAHRADAQVHAAEDQLAEVFHIVSQSAKPTRKSKAQRPFSA